MGTHGSCASSIKDLAVQQKIEKLQTANYEDDPIIDYGYLNDSRDTEILLKGIKIVRQFFKTTVMNNLSAKEVAPGIDVTNDAELEKFLKATALSVYHPVGTCKMGLDSTSVVDPELRVHGVEGLRVADASILPQLISGNTNHWFRGFIYHLRGSTYTRIAESQCDYSGSANTDFSHCGFNVMYDCQVGDKVWVTLDNQSNTSVYCGSSWSNFTGKLISL